MVLEFDGELWYWRGPAPFHFVTVPQSEAAEIEEISGRVSYGWGMIPVRVEVGGTRWTTALWPKDGSYVVPIKNNVRAAEDLELGTAVTVRLTIDD